MDILVITKYGASGDYHACTDLAYKKAKSDGADVLDCLVQMSKDGIPFCLSSIYLSESTTVADTKFKNRATTIREIKNRSGIYTFSLTWDEIKSKFERVYKVDKNISDAADSAIKDIKTFADSVVIGKASVFPETAAFLVSSTNTLARLKSFN